MPSTRVLSVGQCSYDHGMISRTLEHAFDVRVQSAAATDDALEKLRTEPFDLVLVNRILDRDGSSGLDLIRAIKADPELADIPVIMVTFVQEKGLGFSLGAADYLVKPVQWARLKEVLDRYRSPGSALVMEGDSETRAELRRLLEGEGWTVEEAADRPAVLRRMNEGPLPGLVLAAVPADGVGLELIGEIRRHPEWRSVPLIALAENELSPDEVERLRGQVRRIVRSEDDLPDELIAELRRIAAGRAKPPAQATPEAATATP